MSLMTAVLKKQAGPGITITKIPVPEPQKDEVLVEVMCASICGTDVGIYDWGTWAQAHIKPPMVIGHEVVGKIIGINSHQATDLKKGDIVSSETHIYCGHCAACKAGNKHICENMQLFGISRNGGFAQYATIPVRTVWKNNKELSTELMSIQEPLGNAIHLINTAQIAHKRILILGLGPVGLCVGALAKQYGVKEAVALEKSSYRRELAHQLGLHYVYDQAPNSLENRFDVVLEMSGDPTMIRNSFKYLKPGGLFVAFGIPKTDVTLNWAESLINKEITIKSVFGRKIWETWQEVQSVLLNPKTHLQPLITHKFELENFDEAIQVMKSGECGKIILYPRT